LYFVFGQSGRGNTKYETRNTKKMKIFDSHVHLFNRKVIENVSRRRGLVERLKLQTRDAADRMDIESLDRSLEATRVAGGLVLPTAGPADVARINNLFYEKISAHPFLKTAGTLHPDDPNAGQEIGKLCRNGARAVKLCSFSQGFVLDGPPALKLFDLIQHHNEECPLPFFIVLDTLYRADHWFGSHPSYNTTPEKIRTLVQRYPAINFVAAHMGGLSAPFEEIRTHLIPCANLYLDTSNAAHTLAEEEFVELLERFGPGHIIFGTDWPWFIHQTEIASIQRLTTQAGFGPEEKQAVFYENIANLLGLQLEKGTFTSFRPETQLTSLPETADRADCGDTGSTYSGEDRRRLRPSNLPE
jgi:predicted TIM-barrel fold metal-dependent hydrolase